MSNLNLFRYFVDRISLKLYLLIKTTFKQIYIIIITNNK